MSRASRAGVSLFTVILLVSIVGAASGVVWATDHSASGGGTAQLGDAGIEPDGVLLRVDLREDGSALWTVEYRVRLTDENTTAAFESLQADIEDDETAYTATFGERMQATARAAENATGREMRVQNVSVGTSRQQLPQEYGVVTYGFTWTGFATTTAEGLEAGDALAGLFLDRQTTLVVAWSDEYGATTVDPAPDERRDHAVVWVGPTDFGTGQPTITLSTATTEGASTGGNAGDDAGTDADAADGSETTPLLVIVGGVALVVVSAVVVVAWRRSQNQGGTATDEGENEIGAGFGSSTGDRASGGDDTSTVDRTDTGSEGSIPSAGASTASEDEATDDSPPVDPWTDELLSNEERVFALLEHNDGRMKQQAIATELEWSAAKTSQVIGKMRDAGDVETFRLGRENVVSFPEQGLS